MHNDQKRFPSAYYSYSVPAPFPMLINAVFSEQQLGICEHQRRRGEIDTVLSEVGSIFARVPFKMHPSIQVYLRVTAGATF